MKKFLILSLVFACLLSGCVPGAVVEETLAPQEQTLPPTEELPEIVPDATEAPTEAVTPAYTQLPMVAVSLPIVTEYVTCDDGTSLYYHTYQDIHLVVQDQQVADAIIIDFLNRNDEFIAYSQTIQQQALSDYTATEDWTPYFTQTLYSPMRIDHSVISLFGSNILYNGGNRPSLECLSANYSTVTGDVLTLGSILTGIDAIDDLCELVIDQLESTKEATGLYNDYEDVARHRFSKEASYDQDWFFSENGLCFYFAPYEIAPYIHGIITAEVPYHLLSGIIADSFFPAEEDTAIGTIQASLLKDSALESFTQIAEISLDANGEQVFLSCDGLVRNVCIEVGTWNEDMTEFIPTCTVFKTYTLSPGDGITLTAQFPDILPVLRLSYTTTESITTQYITQSGEDGSILLIS